MAFYLLHFMSVKVRQVQSGAEIALCFTTLGKCITGALIRCRLFFRPRRTERLEELDMDSGAPADPIKSLSASK